MRNASLPFQGGDFRSGIATAPDDRQNKLQPQGPTFGVFLQLHRDIRACGGAETGPEQLRGFLETELKDLRADDDTFAVFDEVVDPELAIRP